MTWEQLGTIVPSHDWKVLGTLPNGGQLFRLTQQWNGDWPGSGFLQISFVYEGAGRFGYSKTNADKVPSVINSPIPEALQSAGFLSRQIAIKLNLFARTYAGAEWVVSVDQWVPEQSS